MTQASHALTHMTNQGITRTPLPALLPTILAGLFILASCGGAALPTDVTIAPTGANTENKLDTNVPVAGFLGVGEQPPVDTAKSAPPANPPANTPAVNPIVQVQKQVQVKKQEQVPAPVFEVASAPVFAVAPPQERSFSTEPVTETETVTRDDTTAPQTVADTVTFTDWVGSFSGTLPSRATTLEFDGKASGTKNQFLSGKAGYLDERPLEEDGRVALVTNRGSLNLATATNNGIALGGDATDGVSFFRGFGSGNVINQDTKSTTGHNYAGLYSGTDLGKPLGLTFRGETSATWKGHIRTLGYFNFDTDIDLIVNFGTKRLTVREFTNPTNAREHLSVAARYNDDGVISGTIIIDADGAGFGIEDEYGFVTGLIGAQGAVAAFLSSGYNSEGGRRNKLFAQGTKENIAEGDHQFGYAGGFVARPATLPPTVVDVSDLLNYANIPTTIADLPKLASAPDEPPNRGFLRIEDSASLDTTGIDIIITDLLDNTKTITNQTFTARRNALIASSKKSIGDGYTFINETGYVAMLPTTDLGAARPIGADQPANASWEGAYSLTSSLGLQALLAPITFAIDFTQGFLTGSADIPLDAGKRITIVAGFDANGFIDGAFNTDSAIPVEAGNRTVIGLIGEEGLVGIMQDVDTAGNGYAGGFTASPPSE